MVVDPFRLPSWRGSHEHPGGGDVLAESIDHRDTLRRESEGIDHHEDRSQDARLAVAEMELARTASSTALMTLAVDVVEEVGRSEHDEDAPGIEGQVAFTHRGPFLETDRSMSVVCPASGSIDPAYAALRVVLSVVGKTRHGSVPLLRLAAR